MTRATWEGGWTFLQPANPNTPLKDPLWEGLLGHPSRGWGAHVPACPWGLALPPRLPQPPYRPTSNSSRSPARGLSRLQMSMVKSVLLLLKMDVSDDMSAAIITAIISPRRPGGQGRGCCDPAQEPLLPASSCLRLHCQERPFTGPREQSPGRKEAGGVHGRKAQTREERQEAKSNCGAGVGRWGEAGGGVLLDLRLEPAACGAPLSQRG